MTFHQPAGFANNRVGQRLVTRRSEKFAPIAARGLFGNTDAGYYRGEGIGRRMGAHDAG